LRTRDLEKTLVDATESVRTKVSARAARGGRGRTVGVGAAGDHTIQADKEAEDVLLGALEPYGVKVLSEEAGMTGDPKGETLAVVDPLDGSSNFERGVPFYCTSVAIVEGRRLEDITLGVIRDLVRGDVYVAKRGEGATKNGKLIRTSSVTRTREAVVGIDISRSTPQLVSRLARLASGVKRQTHYGANALELCYVADGRIDAFVDVRGKMRITDFAAAYLIAKEAGGELTDEGGGQLVPHFDLEHRFSFVASANQQLHGEILKMCRAEG
jgi:myo-inositol-1(or 4)-monophosphatase